jgi:hypothetical protein
MVHLSDGGSQGLQAVVVVRRGNLTRALLGCGFRDATRRGAHDLRLGERHKLHRFRSTAKPQLNSDPW